MPINGTRQVVRELELLRSEIATWVQEETGWKVQTLQRPRKWIRVREGEERPPRSLQAVPSFSGAGLLREAVPGWESTEGGAKTMKDLSITLSQWPIWR